MPKHAGPGQAGIPATRKGATHGQSAARGFAFSGGQVLVNRILSLLGFVVLARLLSPEDYGVAALANVFVALFAALSAGGFGQALVQRKEIDQRYIDTTFWISAFSGALMTAGMLGAAFPLSWALHQPQLRAVLMVLSLNFLVIGLSSTQTALLQRGMRFGAIARCSVLANVVATATGIGFAFSGFGVWSLVIQTLLDPTVTAVGLWRVSHYRPGRSVDRGLARPIFRTSRQFLGSTLLDFLSQRTDDFLIGARLGTLALGIYTIAYRLVLVVMNVLANSVKLVALPAFAKLQGDKARLRSAYERSLGVSSSIVMPCFAFLVAAAPTVVTGLFGARWASAVPPMRVLCVYGALEGVMIINGVFLQATGQAHVQLRLTLAGTALQVIAFFVAAPFGLTWVAAAYVLRAYVMAPIGLRFASRCIGTSVVRSLRRIAGPAVAATVMAVTVFVVEEFAAPISTGLRTLVLLATGISAYLLALRILSRSHLTELATTTRDLRGSRRRAAATVSP